VAYGGHSRHAVSARLNITSLLVQRLGFDDDLSVRVSSISHADSYRFDKGPGQAFKTEEVEMRSAC
jgi:hypothetical protein